MTIPYTADLLEKDTKFVLLVLEAFFRGEDCISMSLLEVYYTMLVEAINVELDFLDCGMFTCLL